MRLRLTGIDSTEESSVYLISVVIEQTKHLFKIFVQADGDIPVVTEDGKLFSVLGSDIELYANILKLVGEYHRIAKNQYTTEVDIPILEQA